MTWINERSCFFFVIDFYVCVCCLFMVAVIVEVLRGPLACNARVAELGPMAIGNLTDVNEHNRNLFAIDDGCDGE